jgi:hypothetical protein
MYKLSALGLALLMVSPCAALAQNSASTTASAPGQHAQQTSMTIKSDLEKQGFKNVRVTPEAFLVQATTQDGHPVVMTMGPFGVSAVEDLSGGQKTGSKGGSASGSNQPAGSPGAGSSSGSHPNQ